MMDVLTDFIAVIISQYIHLSNYHIVQLKLTQCCCVTSVLSNSVWPHRLQPTRLPRDSSGKNTGVGCHFLLQCMKVKSESEVAHSCPTLCDPMDCSLPGSSIHGIFQARILELGAIAFSETYTILYVNYISIKLEKERTNLIDFHYTKTFSDFWYI